MSSPKKPTRDHKGFIDFGDDPPGPMNLNPSNLKDANILNFKNIDTKGLDKRKFKRVTCYGYILLYTGTGKLVAKGALRDLNMKGGGFEIRPAAIKVGDEMYVEFSGPTAIALTHIKVVIRTVKPVAKSEDRNLRVGVEFIGTTASFQQRLETFIANLKDEVTATGFSEGDR